MTALLERISAASRAPAGKKAFSEPFWNVDRLRHSLLSNLTPDRERIENDFEGYVAGIYKRSGPAFSCIRARMMVFSQAEFSWMNRRTRELTVTPELEILDFPWPGGVTVDLLAKMEVDVSLAGNSYVTITDDRQRFGRAATGLGRRLVRMRPDWVTIVIHSASGDPFGLDAKVVGYLYEPPAGSGGIPRAEPVMLTSDQVCHYWLEPDPVAQWRGMSWLTPVLDEISGDRGAVQHKRKFFDNGATLNVVVSFAESVGKEAFDHFVEKFREQHHGADNAYETLFLGGGADAKVVSADMQQLDFKAISGAAETRMASAAGVHPVIVGMSEGMQGAALNAGNFGQVRRLFVDGSLQRMWRSASASLQTIIPPPDASLRLWADGRHIEFLRDDRKDVAEIQRTQAVALRQLYDAGYDDMDGPVRAITSDDYTELLGQHSGTPSVQTQQAQQALEAGTQAGEEQ